MLLIKVISKRVNSINSIYRYYEMQSTKLIASIARLMILVIRLRDTAILILIVMLIRYTY